MATKNFSAQITVGGALSSTFTAAIGGAQKEINSLGKSVKNLASAQASLGKGKGIVDFDALKRSRDSMRQAEAAAAKLRTEFQAAKNPTRAAANALAEAEVAAAKAKSKYDALRKSQLETLREVKAATGSYRVNADTVKKLGDASAVAAGKMALLREAGARVGAIGSTLRTASTRVLQFGTVVAGVTAGVVGSAMALSRSFSEAGDEIAATSFNIGISTKALQQFRYIASLNNVEAADMDKALAKLSTRLAKTVDPSNNLNDELRRLGMGLSATRLRAMGPERAMLAIGDAMAKTQDPAKRLALAAALFGDKAGPRMVSVLAQGAKGMRETAKEASFMDKTMIENAQNQDTAWKKLKDGITDFRNVVGNELSPLFTEFFTEAKKFLTENREEIRLTARAFGDWATKEGREVLKSMAELGKSLAEVVKGLNSVVTATIGWGAALKVVGVLIGAAIVVKIGEVIGKLVSGVRWVWSFIGGWQGLVTAFQWVVRGAATVVGGLTAIGVAIGGAVAAVAYLGYVIWKHWNAMPGIISHGLDLAGQAIGTAFDWWKGLFTGLFDWVMEKVNLVVDGFKSAFTALGEWLTSFWDATIGNIKAAWDTVAGFFGAAGAKPGTALATGALAAGLAAAPGDGIAAPPASTTIPPTASAAAAAGAAAGSTMITVNGAPGQDPRAIAAEVERMIRERERTKRRGGLSD